MTPPKERHQTDREAGGVADPFLKKGFRTPKNFSLGRFKYSFFLRVSSCFTVTSWLIFLAAACRDG
jgi:hypothetical protein